MIIIRHTGICQHCGLKVEEQDWGNGGRFWLHTGSKRVACNNWSATPIPESVTAFNETVSDDH